MIESLFFSESVTTGGELLTYSYQFLLFIATLIAMFVVIYASFGIFRYIKEHGSASKKHILVSGFLLGTCIWASHIAIYLMHQTIAIHAINYISILASYLVAYSISMLIFVRPDTNNSHSLFTVIRSFGVVLSLSFVHLLNMFALSADMEMTVNASLIIMAFSISVLCVYAMFYSLWKTSLTFFSQRAMAAFFFVIAISAIHFVFYYAITFTALDGLGAANDLSDFWLTTLAVAFSCFSVLLSISIITRELVETRHKKHEKIRWHYIYYLLAILNVFTVGSSLAINHFHTANIEHTVSKLSNLQRAESQLLDVKTTIPMVYVQHYTTQEQHIFAQQVQSRLLAQMDESESFFESKFSDTSRIDALLKPTISSVLKSIDEMRDLSKQGQEIEAKITQNIQKNSAYDSLYAEIEHIYNLQHRVLLNIILKLDDGKNVLYAQKRTDTRQIKIYEYLIMGLVSVFVLLATLLGHAVTNKMRMNEKEREVFHRQLEEHRQNLEKQIEEQTREIRAESLKNALLGKIAEHSNQSHTLESALKGALREVMSYSGWQLGHSYLYLEQQKAIQVWYNKSEHPQIKQFIDHTKAIASPLEADVIPGLSHTQNQATWITDIEESDTFTRKFEAMKASLQGMAAIPIILHHQCIGFIEFFSHEKMHPTFETVLILERLSSMMVRIIEKHLNQVSLKAAKERAEDASKAKTEFLSNMSHELRTPMHAILRFSENGAEEFENAEREELQEYFNDIHKSGERLTKLINNLLDLSKLESDLPDLVFTNHSLEEVNDHAIKELQSLLDEKQLTIERYYQETSMPVEMDMGKITQVIVNLLSNAIKFSPEDAKIISSISYGDGLVTYRLSDLGTGVPEDEIDSIFDKFIQSSKTKTKAGGTGLGLSICKEIINLHDGEIFALNNLDGGSSFTFILPIKQTKTEE